MTLQEEAVLTGQRSVFEEAALASSCKVTDWGVSSAGESVDFTYQTADGQRFEVRVRRAEQ